MTGFASCHLVPTHAQRRCPRLLVDGSTSPELEVTSSARVDVCRKAGYSCPKRPSERGDTLMAERMVKTRHAGIFRRGSRWVVTYHVNGVPKKESVRTLDEARKLKAARQADIARGEFQEASRVKFRAYAAEWIERYPGRGSSFRETTRDDYRRNLGRYAYPFFDERLGRTLSQIAPRDVANFIAWLCERKTPGGKPLSDSTVRNVLNPIRACLSTAVREGLIRHNPAHGAVLPHRLTEDELEQDRCGR